MAICHPLLGEWLHIRMKGTEVPNSRRSSACDCICVLTRIDHCTFCLFLPTGVCKVRSRISDALSQALCNLSLAFLADFIAFSLNLHSAFRLDRKT